MARGLNPQRLLAQWAEIDRIRKSLPKSFTLLKGIECDILEKGGMDLPDDVLAQADWVLASVHYGQKQSRQQITERILGAIENPHVSIIAHPTGRLINKRAPMEIDMTQVIEMAGRTHTLLEVNANWMRLDLKDIHVRQALSAGVFLVINTDAHTTEGFDMMQYGVYQARRAGLEKKDVANTRTLAQFKKLLRNA